MGFFFFLGHRDEGEQCDWAIRLQKSRPRLLLLADLCQPSRRTSSRSAGDDDSLPVSPELIGRLN